MVLRKIVTIACACVILLAAPGAVCAQAAASQEAGIPLTRLIAIMAQKTGKKFVVDPRVRGDAMLIDQDPATLDYEDFLTVLHLHAFAAVASGKLVRVLPVQNVRVEATPIVSEGQTRPDGEYVTKIIPVRTMPAAMLVPILRPLLPKDAHFAASDCSNMLIVADTFGNVRRIESLVQSLDKGKPYQPRPCVATSPEIRPRSNRSPID